MNTTIIVIIAILIGLRYLVPWLVRVQSTKKHHRKNDGELRVKSAKLNRDLFENATPNEQEDLLYDFIQKIRLTDNYGTSSIENMPKPLQAVYFINELEAEVNNGGFLQFFTNSSGRYTPETLETLDLIGAKHSEELLKKAIQVLKKHSQSPENLNEKINGKELYELFRASDFYDDDELLEEMQRLDTEFYEYKDDISRLKLAFFKSAGEGLWNEIKEKYGS